MLPYEQISGKMIDWSPNITNVDTDTTPVLAWLPLGSGFKDPIQFYQAEKFADPVRSVHVDGKPVTGFDPAGKDRGELAAFMQYGTGTAAITKVHQEMGNIAGIANGTGASGGDLGKEMVKKLKEFSRSVEANLLSIYGEQKDNQNDKGWATRCIPVWVQSGATNQLSGFETPAAFRPPSASIDATATGSVTENVILGILESMGSVHKSRDPITCICAYKAKAVWNNMPSVIPSTTATTNAGAIPRPLRGTTYTRIIQTYDTDFGPVDLLLSWFNHALDASAVATYKSHSMYFLHDRLWEFDWFKKPEWTLKSPQGGATEVFFETFWRIRCLNPSAEGAYKPAS